MQGSSSSSSASSMHSCPPPYSAMKSQNQGDSYDGGHLGSVRSHGENVEIHELSLQPSNPFNSPLDYTPTHASSPEPPSKTSPTARLKRLILAQTVLQLVILTFLSLLPILFSKHLSTYKLSSGHEPAFTYIIIHTISGYGVATIIAVLVCAYLMASTGGKALSKRRLSEEGRKEVERVLWWMVLVGGWGVIVCMGAAWVGACVAMKKTFGHWYWPNH